MKKLLLNCVLTAVLCLLLAGAAGAASVSDLSYEIKSNGTVKITGCNQSATGELVIPSELEEKPVVDIGVLAFFNCNLTSVSIPDGVTSIGDSAFRYCSSLTSVRIPDSVTSIGNSAFSYCSSLTSIRIPDSVTRIGVEAFTNCKALEAVSLSANMTVMKEKTFYNCTSLIRVDIPAGIKGIEREAFCNCKSLTSVTIPEGVTSIGDLRPRPAAQKMTQNCGSRNRIRRATGFHSMA